MSRDRLKANARRAEVERSPNVFKPRLVKLAGGLAKHTAEHSKVFEDLSYRHKTELSGQVAALQHEVVVPKIETRV